MSWYTWKLSCHFVAFKLSHILLIKVNVNVPYWTKLSNIRIWSNFPISILEIYCLWFTPLLRLIWRQINWNILRQDSVRFHSRHSWHGPTCLYSPWFMQSLTFPPPNGNLCKAFNLCWYENQAFVLKSWSPPTLGERLRA